MKYFPHKPNSMADVWALFDELGKSMQSDGFRGCDNSLEIIQSALNGNKLDAAGFNLAGYSYKCDEFKRFGELKDRKTLLHIVDDTDTDVEKGLAYGDISANKLRSMRDDYAYIEDDISFDSIVVELKELRISCLSRYGVDLLVVVAKSLEGYKEPTEILKSITDVDKEVRAVVWKLATISSDTDRDLGKELSSVSECV